MLRIDFDKLVADYGRMMFENLRGFSVGVEFLETWVPSEDVTESVVQLIEGAAEGGVDKLEIELGEESTERLDSARLRADVGQYGATVLASPTVGGCLIVVVFSRSVPGRPDGFLQVNALYRKALQDMAGRLQFEGPFSTATDSDFLIREGGDGATMHARVDMSSGTIVELRHQGAETVAAAALFDRLCAHGKGIPVQEFADHAVISIETDLRDKSMELGRRGVMLAERLDPLFARANTLARRFARDYRSKAGINSQENFYDRPVGAVWRSLSENGRAELVLRTLAQYASEIGMSPGQLTVVDTRTDTRIVVNLAASIARPQAPVILRAAERVIQREIDPRLELLLTERKDESILRRLSVPERK